LEPSVLGDLPEDTPNVRGVERGATLRCEDEIVQLNGHVSNRRVSYS
jgi:hypothetical protein